MDTEQPIPEPETLTAQLQEFKCPYTFEDPRARTWLEGYKEGYAVATDNAINSLNRLMA